MPPMTTVETAAARNSVANAAPGLRTISPPTTPAISQGPASRAALGGNEKTARPLSGAYSLPQPQKMTPNATASVAMVTRSIVRYRARPVDVTAELMI